MVAVLRQPLSDFISGDAGSRGFMTVPMSEPPRLVDSRRKPVWRRAFALPKLACGKPQKE